MKKKIIEDYQEQKNINEEAFIKLLKVAKPELFVLFDILEQTKVNYFVVLKVIRQIYNIANGTQFGDVTININNGQVLYIRGNESDKVQEPAIIKKLSVE